MLLPDTCIWTVGGGKGRVGKSVVSSLLADALALNDFKTLVVDADAASPSLHRLFGLQMPDKGLPAFTGREVDSLQDVLCSTEKAGLVLLCGADGLLDLADPEYSHREGLLQGISGLGVEFAVVDIGSGTSTRQLDFFNMADTGIVVVNPTQAAIQNAYGFLKLAVTRKLIVNFQGFPHVLDAIKRLLVGNEKVKSINQLVDSVGKDDKESARCIVDTVWDNRYRLVVNMANREEGDRIARSIINTAQEFLSIPLSSMGNIEFNDRVDKSIGVGAPVGLTPGDKFAETLEKAVQSLISSTRLYRKQKAYAAISAGQAKEGNGTASAPIAQAPGPMLPNVKARPEMQTGLNNDIEYDGMMLHVQTEDLGPQKAKIVTHVFYDGRILLSTATDYGELGARGDLNEAVRERVRWQQRVVMAGISSGKLRDRLRL